MYAKPFTDHYHAMIFLAIVAGIAGTAFQFLAGFEILSFLLVIVALGGLIGGSNLYGNQQQQCLLRYYKTTFEWLLLAVFSVYAFIEISRYLPRLSEAATFLNGRWPGLILSLMCVVVGVAGLRREKG